MFTGIVEAMGKVVSLKKEKGNLVIEIEARMANGLKPGQSVAHNGVCLTVETISPSKRKYRVTAVQETLSRTNLGNLKTGDAVNLERCLRAGDRLDGHFVQGHVDTTARVAAIRREKGSREFKFKVTSYKLQVTSLVIEKGSICINGVSLTVARIYPGGIFSVAIIPYTFTHTNFSSLKKGDEVNLEFDILGKYIQNMIQRTAYSREQR